MSFRYKLIVKDWLLINLLKNNIVNDIKNIIRYQLYIISKRREFTAPPVNLILVAMQQNEKYIVYNDITFSFFGHFENDSQPGFFYNDKYFNYVSKNNTYFGRVIIDDLTDIEGVGVKYIVY